MGFFGRLIKECTSLKAELWGIFRRLELIQNQRMEPMEVESDSTFAVVRIMEDPLEHFPYTIMIKECKALREVSGCILRHTLRENNKVADRLTNVGVNQEHKMISHIIPPDDIPFLEVDMRGSGL